MVDIEFQSVEALYEKLHAKTIDLLQGYADTPLTDLRLLLRHEDVREMSVTSLNSLFKSLETLAPSVSINLYSIQQDISVERTYHVEVKPKGSEFCFNMPLHSALSPEHKENGEVVSFFKYLFIQVAALQIASEEEIEITSSFIDEILNYFYEKQDKQERIKEELSMEEKKDLFTFKLGQETGAVEFAPVLDEEAEAEDAPELEEEEAFDFDFDEDEEDFEAGGVDQEVYEQEEETEEVTEEISFLEVDFHTLNKEFNEQYKLAENASDRDQLKHLKADIWEAEMKMEESGLTAEDIQSLAYSILSHEVEGMNVMKWQIAAAKQMMKVVVSR